MTSTYWRRRTRGLCAACEAVITDGRAYCFACRVRQSARDAQRYQRRKLACVLAKRRQAA